MEYATRVVDGELDRMLAELPAVAIVGPKAVGKTATAQRRATSVVNLSDPDETDLVGADLRRVTRLPRPVLIDEWQVLPRVWDVVRRGVDDGAEPGSFLLTGSATPAEQPMHSGAGRIVQLRMRPMTLAERGVAEPTVSLAGLLAGGGAVDGESAVALEDYADEIVASGFPGFRHLSARGNRDSLDTYLRLVVERDFPDAGREVRRPGTLRAWMRAYAAATSTTASYTEILDAATAGEPDKPARTTTAAYRETLERIWLLEEVPAWVGAGSVLTALGRSPKHHLADPALAARLLGVNAASLLDRPDPAGVPVARRGSLFGALFESLVTLCVRVYAEAAGATVSHLRTHRGEHEVDLVVERDDGRILAIEVKLGTAPSDRDVRHLRWLAERAGAGVVDSVVVTTGRTAYRRPDGIAVVPLALLGP
ncbi:ATP-binding protein [Isoptericola variabilis]|uniref:ATP-binding protein n=1 Tax=Isoptericola variabilis TaxID=139208 RepID=UPI003D20DACC